MRRWKGRLLSMGLAAGLMLCQPVFAFGAAWQDPVLPALAQYGESGPGAPDKAGQLDEPAPAPEEPVKPETEPENPQEPAKPETQPEKPEEPGRPEQTDTVSDQDELAEWMQQHSQTGGTVFLGERVTITQPIGVYPSAEIIVDTGAYGLVFDGAALPASNTRITGEGVEMPVVAVLRVGSGLPYELSWNNTLLEAHITATGRDGIGGTALRILRTDTQSFSMGNLSWQGVIRSYGEGAVGLWLESPMEAWCYNVEIFGKNSMAVYAPGGAKLTYCKLTAEGDGAAAVAGNGVELDSCVTSPTPTGVQRISRRAMAESFSRLYLPLQQHTYRPDAIQMLNTPNVFLVDEEGGVISQSFAIDWDLAAYDAIDTGVLGTTMVSGTVAPALYGLRLFENVPIALTVEVRDAVLPCISRIAVRELDGTRYAVLNFWQDYDPMDERVILWRSDDGGKTWVNATHAPDISWHGDSVNFTYGALERPVWFQLEVVGVGESNMAILDEKDGVFVGGNGGDRTGTDRGGVRPPDGGGDPGGGEVGGGDDNTPGGGHGSGDNNGGSPSDGGNMVENGGESKDGGAAENSGPIYGGLDVYTVPTVPAPPPMDIETEAVSAQRPATEAASAQTAPAEGQHAAEKTPPADMAAKAIPAQRPATEAVSTQTALSQSKHTATETPPADTQSESLILMEKDTEALAMDEDIPPFDPEQSAPGPGFPAKALTVFFVGVAVLCAGALLFLRFGRAGRWRRDKA